MNDSPETAEGVPEIERLLESSRPLPSPAFRGALRRRLLATRPPPVPLRVRRVIAAYAGSGAILLLVAAVGIAGGGPFAA
jgi:hypothetical protein